MAAKDKKKKQALNLRFGQMPSRTSINFVTVGEKKINYKLAVPALILIIAVTLLFGKFLVFDRLAQVAAAQKTVNELQARLDADTRELAGFDDLKDLYAHYSYSGFTDEELSRAPRVEVLDIIERVVLPKAAINSWSLRDNELMLELSAGSLRQINGISDALRGEPIVNYCSVSNANTNEVRIDDILTEVVTAKMLVYLNTSAE
jgi:hypothetical protein